MPAGGSQTLALELAAGPRSSIGNRSGHVVLSLGARTVHVRWWGYVERPRLAKQRSLPLAAGRWATGNTRAGTKLVQHYRWPSGPGGSGLPRVYPGREQLWSFMVPKGARNAGVKATGAVVPQILLERSENRLAGEPALPSNGNPYLDTYGRFERVSGLLVPGPGRYFVIVETRPGHAPGPYKLRLWVDDRTPPAIGGFPQRVSRGGDGLLRFRVTDRGSGVSVPDVVVRIDGTEEDVRVTASGQASVRISGLEPGRHRISVTASDLQETKNSENASARPLPNTRTVHAAFTVG